MKKLTSLILAMVSTMLLITGATRAAEKLDPLAQAATPSLSDMAAQVSSPPCIILEDPPISMSV